MNTYKILIIDDNQSVLRTLKLVLNGVFKTVVTVPDPQRYQPYYKLVT